MKIEDFKDVPVFESRHDHLRHAIGASPIDGYALEFGVWKGGSIAVLAEMKPTVFGFDTFKGLPEDLLWGGKVFPKGHFGLESVPVCMDNVVLYKGLFKSTIPEWLKEYPLYISFLHIDSDLYSSCRDVLWGLNERISPGCIIAFDELFDFQTPPSYPEWPDGEWKALQEWMKEFGRECVPLARTGRHQGSVRVTL